MTVCGVSMSTCSVLQCQCRPAIDCQNIIAPTEVQAECVSSVGPACLCVCLERLLLGAYQPSVSLSGLQLIAVVRPRVSQLTGLSPEWRP